jgi:hypothetical protein
MKFQIMTIYQYKDHDYIKVNDRRAKIWRYMDLWKFHAMLKSKSLYFCRADKLGDKFEGSLPKKNIERENDNLRRGNAEDRSQLIDSGRIEDLPRKLRIDASLRNQCHRKFVFVNCWCKGEDESAAMWDLYIRAKQGIAITSTIQKLIDNFNLTAQKTETDRTKQEVKNVYIGEVKYINFAKEEIPTSCLSQIHRFAYKMKSFGYENEVRLLFGPEHSYDVSQSESPNFGIELQVLDINNLIDEIYIHPEAPKDYEEIVQCMIDKHGIYKQVQRTDLSKEPLF